MGVCRLSIDYNRSFKYLAAYDIKNYIEKFNTEPSVLMIDAPRDEETRLVLPSTIYYPPLVDVRVSGFIEALEEDKELKKFITILVCTNK